MNHVVQCWLHDMDDVVDVDLHTTCSVLVKTGFSLCFMNSDGMCGVLSLLYMRFKNEPMNVSWYHHYG